MPTPKAGCNDGCAGILCQLSSSCAQESTGTWVLANFSVKSINRYYNLESVNPEAYDWLHENPNYPEVLRMLINGQGEWKLNNEGYVVHFKAKHLAYIPKVWHHFITSRLIPTTTVCEVTVKRALLNKPSFRTSLLMSVGS